MRVRRAAGAAPRRPAPTAARAAAVHASRRGRRPPDFDCVFLNTVYYKKPVACKWPGRARSGEEPSEAQLDDCTLFFRCAPLFQAAPPALGRTTFPKVSRPISPRRCRQARL